MPQQKAALRDSNYIVIQGWMITKLGLKGNELLIYAVIYGFSQDGEADFRGSMKYLAEWTNSSVESVRKCLNALIAKNYIVKVSIDNKINVYKVLPVDYSQSYPQNADNFSAGRETPGAPGVKIQQSCINHTTKLHQPYNKVASTIQQSCINNNKDKDNDNDTYTPPCGCDSARRAESDFERLWELYPRARRQGKKTAKQQYMAALKRGVSPERIEAGLRRYADYVARAQVEDRYVMQAVTFFRGARWDDEYGAVPPRQPQRNPTLGYKQRTYTAEQLCALGVDLGDDVYKD